MSRMTLDPEHDAQERAVRGALEDLRGVIQVIAHEGGVERESYVLGYVDSVDHLLRVFAENRPDFTGTPIAESCGAIWAPSRTCPTAASESAS